MEEKTVESRDGNVQLRIELTERQKTQVALRQSEERYRTLFQFMTEGFALHEIICDEQGEPCDYRFLDINPAFEKLTGLKREDVIDKTLTRCCPRRIRIGSVRTARLPSPVNPLSSTITPRR